ncbi:endonuclease/exonuclease/phosphatase family protein [bacterium]|nr:endonuclease/exonuclease/phosphatase family protein [bacterium]
MRRNVTLLSIFVIILLTIGCSREVYDESIRVMTFNIRLNTPADGPNAWPYRKEIATSMIRFHQADIAGLQEALKDQVDDLVNLLPEYDWFGIGRDDGKEAGEFMAIFYRRDRFEVIQDSTFWLSETPAMPTKGWDGACYRVVTWGQFRDLRTGKIFYLFNTHFDHIGETARQESAKLLLRSIDEIAGNAPIVVTGDFNATPDDEPYRIITEGLSEKPSTKLIDTKGISKYSHHGPNGTITWFESANLEDNKTIDYIFIKNNVSVNQHGTLSDSFDGRFPTDHMPVLAEILID